MTLDYEETISGGYRVYVGWRVYLIQQDLETYLWEVCNQDKVIHTAQTWVAALDWVVGNFHEYTWK